MSTPIAFNPVLPPSVNPEVRKKFRDLAEIVEVSPYRCSFSFDAEGTTAADTHRITIQTRNRRGDVLRGSWRVEFYTSTSPEGPPVSLGHTLSVLNGQVTETIVGAAHYRCLTDSDGQIVFDLTIAGPATRYVIAKIDGHSEASEAIAWA